MDALAWEAVHEGKEALAGVKSAAEIAQYEVDERLCDTERANLFMTGGHVIQERWAIDSLPSLLSDKGRAAWDAVHTNLEALLQQRAADTELQVAVAEALRSAVQQRALPAADAAGCFLPLAVSYVKAGDDSADEAAAAWEALLLELLPLLPARQLAEAVLPIALAKGRVNEPVASRVSCCRLLGAMVPHAQPSNTPAAPGMLQRFAPQLLAACQDTDYQVRMAAAQQLPALARALGPGATVVQLLPELKELLEDDEVQVRVLAFTALVACCSMVTPEQRRSHLLPAVRRHMQPLELALPLQRTLAAAFPELLATIRDDLEPSDAGMLYGCFRHLAARADVELRVTCALRLPALMAAPLPGSSATYLHDTWTDLALDHDVQVRTAIACQLHLAARTVAAADAARLVQRPIVALLRDSSAAVREALLPGLGETLQVLSCADELHKPGLASELHQALQVLVGGLSASWRLQQHVAAALPALPGLISSDALAEHWAAYAFGLLLSGPACVKPAAATGLACLLRGLQKERQRTELHCRLIRELAWGRSCWARLAYVQLCGAALRVFSCRWFKQHLLEGVMELLADGVAAVRLAALALLPALKQTIRLPEDVEQLEQLNTAMSSLMTDNDRDVSHAARCVHETFKRTPLHVTGGAGLLNLSGAPTGTAEFEAADRAKEEEEQQLTLAQDEMERLRVDWWASAPERRSRRLGGLGIAGDSSSSSSSGHQALLRKNNSKGRMDNSHTASGSAGSAGGSAAAGRGNAALGGPAGTSGGAGGMGRGGGASSGGGWGHDSSSSGSSSSSRGMASSDRRFGSGPASSGSSSSSCCSNTSAGGAAAGAAAGQFSGRVGRDQPPACATGGRPGAPRSTVAAAASAGGGGLSVATSPRHPGSAAAAGAGGPRSPKPGGSGGGGLAASQPLTSPTGTNPFANLRLPVLAASPKATGATGAAAAGAKWPLADAPSGGGGGVSLTSSLGSSVAAASSSRIGAAAAAAGSVSSSSSSSSFGRSAIPGSLAAAAGAAGTTAVLGSSKGGGTTASRTTGKSGVLASSVGASRLLGISGSSAPVSTAAQHASSSSSSSSSAIASGAAVVRRFR